MPSSANVATKTATLSPAYTKIIEEFRRPAQPRSLGDYYSDWNKRVKAMEKEDEAESFFKNIDPKELGFTTGPAMSEAQFKAYREGKGPTFAQMYDEAHRLKKKDST